MLSVAVFVFLVVAAASPLLHVQLWFGGTTGDCFIHALPCLSVWRKSEALPASDHMTSACYCSLHLQ